MAFLIMKILNFLTIFTLCCLIIGITIMLVISFIGMVAHALVGNFILSLCYFLFLCFLISLIIVIFKGVS